MGGSGREAGGRGRSASELTNRSVEARRTAGSDSINLEGLEGGLLHLLVVCETCEVVAGEVNDSLVGVGGEANPRTRLAQDDREGGDELLVDRVLWDVRDEGIGSPVGNELIDFL